MYSCGQIKKFWCVSLQIGFRVQRAAETGVSENEENPVRIISVTPVKNIDPVKNKVNFSNLMSFSHGDSYYSFMIGVKSHLAQYI